MSDSLSIMYNCCLSRLLLCLSCPLSTVLCSFNWIGLPVNAPPLLSVTPSYFFHSLLSNVAIFRPTTQFSFTASEALWATDWLYFRGFCCYLRMVVRRIMFITMTVIFSLISLSKLYFEQFLLAFTGKNFYYYLVMSF